MTKRTLAVYQRRHEKALIACHLLEDKPPVGSRITKWHVTTDHQRHTPTKPSKDYPEELGLVLFPDQQACKEIFAILPRFLEDLLQSEDLVGDAMTRTKIALTIFQF